MNTRQPKPEQKGRRTKTRKQQILESYEKCRDEDVKILKQQLEEMGEYADSMLQGDKLFLYYMQRGKCMYSGQPIDLTRLGTKLYDIEHIYPQSVVKDDSILNNKVLVLSEENGAKGDTYPISGKIRQNMGGYWQSLLQTGAISEEKYKRLVRATPLSDEEKMGFINRQITETSQSTKAVATLLGEKFPQAKVVYCKASVTSDFRQAFDLLKSRQFNDLHHAKDAYLNIVTGNVYHMRFAPPFHVQSQYNVQVEKIFGKPVVCGGKTIWDGADMLGKVKRTVAKNNAHFTQYAYFKKGGLFDQQPKPAATGLVPLKKGLPTEKYGGYNRPGVMSFIPVKYRAGKKTDVMVMSVELLYGKQFLADEQFARIYAAERIRHILGKEAEILSFPMGMRPWKVNTVLSLDGFRVCLSGSSGAGKCVIAQPMMPFSEAPCWETYMKRLEKFAEKVGKNSNYPYKEEYDKISKTKNEELYEIYLHKLQHSVYQKRVNAPTKLLSEGRERFGALDIKEQAAVLLNLHQIFGRMTQGCDLQAIGGSSRAASTSSFSSMLSNWKKYYSDVRLIDSSPSGLWETRSENLLEWL